MIKPADTAVLWSFYRNSQGFIMLAIAVLLTMWALALRWPGLASSGLVFCICLMGWMFAVRSPTMITNHHLNLPVSTGRLTVLSGLYSISMLIALSLLTLCGFNVLGGQWNLSEVPLACGVLGLLLIAVANVVHAEGQEGFESLVAGLVGVFAFDAMGLAPDAMLQRVQWMHRFRFPLCLATAVLAWLLAYFALHHRRSTGLSLLQWLFRFDFPLTDLFRPKPDTPSSRLDGVIELDWRRSFEGSALAAIGAVFLVVLLYLLADERTAFMGWLTGFVIIPMSGYIVALGFSSYDKAKNGAFRWTLPVTDKELAYGMLWFLFRAVISIWFIWVVGLVVLLTVHGLQGQNLIDEFRGLRQLGQVRSLASIFFLGLIGLLVGWVGGSIGLIHNYVGRGRDTLLVLLICVSPVLVQLMMSWYVPAQYHFVFAQTIMAVAGLWMVVRTVRMFGFGIAGEYVTRQQVRLAGGLWLFASVVFGIPIVWLGLGVGTAILLAGTLALAIYPWVGLPFAIQAVRHWYFPYSAR